MKKMMLLPFLKYLKIVTMALNTIVLVFSRAVFFCHMNIHILAKKPKPFVAKIQQLGMCRTLQ
jgi:hypothetical protein